MSRVLSKIRVCLDVLNEDPNRADWFAAWSYGNHWNGWAVPYFERHEAEQIVEAFKRHGTQASYDSASDSFEFVDEDGETESYAGIVVQGMRLYPIGASVWTWDDQGE